MKFLLKLVGKIFCPHKWVFDGLFPMIGVSRYKCHRCGRYNYIRFHGDGGE